MTRHSPEVKSGDEGNQNHNSGDGELKPANPPSQRKLCPRYSVLIHPHEDEQNLSEQYDNGPENHERPGHMSSCRKMVHDQ